MVWFNKDYFAEKFNMVEMIDIRGNLETLGMILNNLKDVKVKKEKEIVKNLA
jgi:hypothetical protein